MFVYKILVKSIEHLKLVLSGPIYTPWIFLIFSYFSILNTQRRVPVVLPVFCQIVFVFPLVKSSDFTGVRLRKIAHISNGRFIHFNLIEIRCR